MEARDKLNTVFCDELLAEILSKLHDLVDRQNASLVCRRWLKIQRTSKSALGLYIPTDEMPSACLFPMVPDLIAQHPYVTKLAIKSGSRIVSETQSSKIVQAVSVSCKSLKHFIFTAGRLSAPDLHDLSNGCPNLSALEILQPASANCLPVLHRFQSLQELCLIGDPASLVENNHDPHNRLYSVYGSLPLANLRLDNIGAHSGCDLEWLWRSCHQLQKLELLQCDGVGDHNTSMSAFVHSMPSLHELKLHRCRTIAGKVLELVSEFSPELRVLTVHDGADTQWLRQVIRKCKRLELLDLRLPLDLSNEDLMEIAQSGRELRGLRLHSCWMATGADMRLLASNITPQLEELVLVKCRAIVHDPGTLLALGQSLKNLKRIDLSENESLSDNELALMLASCHDVRHLRLFKCNRLMDKILDFIGQRCTMLESIDIRSCSGIGKEGVSSLLTRCGSLRQVLIEADKVTVELRKLAASKRVVFACENSSVIGNGSKSMK